MNIHSLTHAVSVTNTKADCLDFLGLDHSTRNYRLMSDAIKKHGIDTSHFVGIKASEYVARFKPVDNQF